MKTDTSVEPQRLHNGQHPPFVNAPAFGTGEDLAHEQHVPSYEVEDIHTGDDVIPCGFQMSLRGCPRIPRSLRPRCLPPFSTMSRSAVR